MTTHRATLEYTRLAGDDDLDDAAPPPPPDPAASGTVDVLHDNTASVSWRATIDGGPVDLSVRASGRDRTEATKRAGDVAAHVQQAIRARAAVAAASSSPLAHVLAALVPPQARAAVRAARVVSRLARSGRLRGVFRRLRGGARVLARALDAGVS